MPSWTSLLTQSNRFQENRQSLGMVVDAYGELLGLDLPLDGALTLNGLIMECPEAGVTIRIAGCTVEIVQVAGRMVKTARVRSGQAVHGVHIIS